MECIIDDGITNTVIDTSTLSIKNMKYTARFGNGHEYILKYNVAPFPPPTNVRPIRAMPGELTFGWSPPPQKCPSFTLSVISKLMIAECVRTIQPSAIQHAHAEIFLFLTHVQVIIMWKS